MNKRLEDPVNREDHRIFEKLKRLLTYYGSYAAATEKLRQTDKNFQACFGTDRAGIMMFLGPRPSADAEIDHIIEKRAFVYVVMHEYGLDLPIGMKLANRLENLQWLSKDAHRLKSARDSSLEGREAQKQLAREFIREHPECLRFNREEFDLVDAHATSRTYTRHT